MEIRVPEKEVEFKASVGEDGRVVLKRKDTLREVLGIRTLKLLGLKEALR